jgi:hypothetical protein
MFNNRYGLTEAVLSGRKTQTRRMIPIDLYNACDWGEEIPMFEDGDGDWHPFYEWRYVYKVGEVVAVAQSYKDFYDDTCDPRIFPSGAGWSNSRGCSLESECAHIYRKKIFNHVNEIKPAKSKNMNLSN